MGPLQSQLGLLSPEDRVLYKRWFRRGLLVYGSVLALLIVAVFANHVFSPLPSDVAGDTMHTAAISAKK
jgi:hypothetical protein